MSLIIKDTTSFPFFTEYGLCCQTQADKGHETPKARSEGNSQHYRGHKTVCVVTDCGLTFSDLFVILLLTVSAIVINS